MFYRNFEFIYLYLYVLLLLCTFRHTVLTRPAFRTKIFIHIRV